MARSSSSPSRARRLCSPILAASLLSIGACDSGSDASDSADAGKSSPPLDRSKLPKLIDRPIPKDAKAVLSLHADKPLSAYSKKDDILDHLTKEERTAMDADIKALEAQVHGLNFEQFSGVTAYASDIVTYAAILEGVSGSPRGEAADPIDGVSVVTLPELPILAAADEGRLYLGSAMGISSALAVARGKKPGLAKDKGPLSEILGEDERGYFLLAARLDIVPPSMMGELGPLAVEAVRLGYDGREVDIQVKASKEKLEKLLAMYEEYSQMAVENLKGEREKASKPEEELALVYTYYLALSMSRKLRPVLEGERLVLRGEVTAGEGGAQDALIITAVVGILSAIAIPALSKYMRQAKTSEAKANIAKLFDRIATQAGAGGCPGTNGVSVGDTSLTPPLSTACAQGPGGRCVPADQPIDDAGYYASSAWSGHPVWKALDFKIEEGHYYHYSYKWKQVDPGGCQFTVAAFGDLNDDGIYSTFERAGAIGPDGEVNAAAGLFSEHETE